MGESTRHVTHRLERWLLKRRDDKPLAIVFGGVCNGLSFVRSLGRRGVPTLLLESERFLGTFTRFGRVVMLPPADQCEDEWLKFLQYIGRRLNRQGVLLPTSDLHSLLVSRHAESLRPYFRFVVPEMGRLMRIVNKRWQYEDAAAAGIAIPQVHFPESVADAARLARHMSYPCLLKPYESHTARKKLGGKLVVVHSGGELVERYESITAMKVALMIQELIRGPETDLVTHMAFWDADGCERAWLTTRKLRQSPPSFGDGCLQITADIPEVPELSRKLLRALRYTGFVGVEFKYDARDNTHRLIEINPRTMLGNQLAITAGIDLPWIGYQYLTGAESIPPEPFRRGVKWVNEEGDIQTFLALWKAGQINPSQWLDSLRRVESRALWAWDDPMPLLAGFWRFLRRVFTVFVSVPGRRDAEPQSGRVGATLLAKENSAAMR